jgi:hypothetical protein
MTQSEQTEKQTVTAQALIELANEALKTHQDYVEGVKVHQVTQMPGTLIFKGESFLDHDGLPTLKSTQAFNLYKWLSHQFKDKYQLS